MAKKRVKITVTVNPDFYPILQALPPILDMSRDDMIEQALKSQYREQIAQLIGLAQDASKDEEEDEESMLILEPAV